MRSSPVLGQRASANRWLATMLAATLVACGASSTQEGTPRANPSASAAPTAAEIHTPVVPPEARALKDDLFAVSAENETAVEVARSVLEHGGSATDAAIAGVLVGCAAHAASCSIGGGGAAIVWQAAEKRAIVLDFRETAPAGVGSIEYLSKTPPKNKRGLLVGTPGLVAGLFEMHKRGGKLPWADVVGLAAAEVAKGIPLSPYMAQATEWAADWASQDPKARAVAPANAKNRVGEKIENQALAQTLTLLAEKGPDAIYRGEVASKMVEAVRAVEGTMRHADLTSYQVVVREPLVVDYDDVKVLLPPPPSGAGFNVAQVLGMFTPSDLIEMKPGSVKYVHAIAEGLRASYGDRTRFVGDPAYTKADLAKLLDPASLRDQRAKFPEDTTTMPRLRGIAESGTFHISVVDGLGNVVACTASLGAAFGSKIVTEHGFALNDAMADFAYDDYEEKLITRGPNFVRGGARPVSNFVPTLVVQNGEPTHALGASGGLRGTTGMLQVLFHVLAEEQPLADAIAAPRMHVTSSGALKLDPPLEGIATDLTKRGEVVEVKSVSFSAVSGIAIRRVERARVLEPVFDARKGGASTVGHSEAPQAPAGVSTP